MLTIRRATYDDIPSIMQFMDKYWKEGNILAKNREFFEWQFRDEDKLNMFLGIDEDNNKIYGIVGAVVYNQSSNPDISGCTWQVIRSNNPILGLELAEYMNQQLNVRYNCGAGLSKKSLKINKLLGCAITSMDHYYRLADIENFKIAKIKKKVIPTVKGTGYRLEHLNTVEEMKQIISEDALAKCIMSKDYMYIEKRYFKHPIYQYNIWKIVDEEKKAHSVLITRDETVQDRKVCKIIDFYGELEDLSRITAALDQLIREKNYEFVDIYSYGVSTELYKQAGFCECNENSENIIPNYFHPFVQENITLKMVDYRIPGLRLFRGDGDQDRPC